MRFGLPLLALIGLVGCAGPKPQAGGSAPIAAGAELGLLAALPQQVAILTRQGDAQPDPSPDSLSGAFQRYAAPGAAATIYLFRRDTAAIPDGPDSPVARAELQGAALVAAIAQGLSLRPPKPPARSEILLRDGNDGGTTRCERQVAVLSEDRAVSDFTCVTGLRQRLLKFRVTINHAPSQTEAPTGLTGAFVTAIRRNLLGTPAPSPSNPPGTLRT